MKPHQIIEHFVAMKSCPNHELANKFVEHYYKAIDMSQSAINAVGLYAYYPKDTSNYSRAIDWFNNFSNSNEKKTMDGGIVFRSPEKYQLRIHGVMRL